LVIRAGAYTFQNEKKSRLKCWHKILQREKILTFYSGGRFPGPDDRKEGNLKGRPTFIAQNQKLA
jgi:hypothetical protein